MNNELKNCARELGISPDDLYVMLTGPQERPATHGEDDEIKASIIKSLDGNTGFGTEDLWSLDVDTLLFLAAERSEEKHAAEADATNIEDMPTDMYSEIEKKLDTDGFADLTRSSPAFRKWVVEKDVWKSRTERITNDELVTYPHENPYWSLRAYELSRIKRSIDGKPFSDDSLRDHDRLQYRFSHEFSPKNTIIVAVFKFLPNNSATVAQPGVVLYFEKMNSMDADAVAGIHAIRKNLERKIMRAGYELSRRSEYESFFPVAPPYDNYKGRYIYNTDGDRDLMSLIQAAIYAVYSEGYRFKEIVTEHTYGFDTKNLEISAPLVASGNSAKRIKSRGGKVYYETAYLADGTAHEEIVSGIRNGVIILFDRDGQFVMVQSRGSGLWMFPGGIIDKGETPWQATVREWREETEQPFHAIYDTMFYFDYGRDRPHTRIFVAGISKGQPYVGDTLTNAETRRVELFTLKDGQFPRNMVDHVRRSFKFIAPELSEIETYFEVLNRKTRFSPLDAPVDLVYDGEF